jgi:CTD small phosphatase-like protein 2
MNPYPYFLPVYSGDAFLPCKTRRTPKLTVVLDLDETLVHAAMSPKEGFDDLISLDEGHLPSKLYVGRRPQLMQFLSTASQLFELVLFTASHPSYAHQLLDLIDPGKRFLKYRLTREACALYTGAPLSPSATPSKGNSAEGAEGQDLGTIGDQRNLHSGVLIKDLRCLGRDLRQVVLVDNNPWSFLFQPYNGIPIASWVGDRDDRMLDSLLQFLIEISKTDDVRPVLKAIALRRGAQ